jgi:hypothetical protein
MAMAIISCPDEPPVRPLRLSPLLELGIERFILIFIDRNCF